MFAFTLCLVLLLSAKSYGQEEEWQPRAINITVLNSQDNNQCPSDEERERGRNELHYEVTPILTEYVESITPISECGGPGWRQVVFINMTDTSYSCPAGQQLTQYSKRTCGRTHSNGQRCSSTTLLVDGSQYNRVCGRIIGYQFGGTTSFRGYNVNSNSLDEQYVSGISLTHGPHGQRQHIWTFAAGVTEAGHSEADNLCPCDQTTVGSPPFVGNDYFCESGTDREWGSGFHGVFFPNDPLWDGQGCSSTSTCCEFNNPPWFTKKLPNPTTDAIDLRLCTFNSFGLSDIALELVELYVQ